MIYITLRFSFKKTLLYKSYCNLRLSHYLLRVKYFHGDILWSVCFIHPDFLMYISHCVMPAFSKYDDISSKEDTEEEVIYSDGELFEGYPYPNNTWDSQDSLYEYEHKVSGWI